MNTSPALPQAQPHQDAPLASRYYVILAVLAAVVGLVASYVTAEFFILGLERTESDVIARSTLVSAGILMIVCELACFFIAAVVPRERLRALRAQLMICASVLVFFEFATISVTQLMLSAGAESINRGADEKAKQIRGVIASNRATVQALREAGARSSDSRILSSRLDGAQSLRQAADIERETAQLVASLAKAQAEASPSLSSTIGESAALVYTISRSCLITVMGIVMFGASGALFRAARGNATATQAKGGQDGATKHGANRHGDTESTAVKYPSLWTSAAAAVPMAAMPAAAAFAMPVPAVTAQAISTATDHRVESKSTQQHEETEPTQSPAKAAKTAGRKAVRVSEKGALDTGTEGLASARYQRVVAQVRAGTVKPSVRAIQAAEGGSTVIARRYLQAMEDAKIIIRSGQGYKLAD